MKMKYGIRAIAAAILSFAAIASSNAGTLYVGQWNSPNGIYSADLTAKTVTQLGTYGPLITGMEGIGDTDLYVFNQTNGIVSKIDPGTGVSSLFYNLSNLGISVSGEGTFAMNSDLTGFVSTSSGDVGTYWTFNLNTNTATSLGQGISFDGVDYAPNGTLYGLTQSSSTPGGSALYIIDPLTGNTTLIGSTGITGESLAGLVVAEGDFIAGIGPNLYSLNPLTAAPTFLFNPGVGPISGLAYLGSTNPTNPIPEPEIYAMLGIGLGLMGWVGRRKKLQAA